MFLCARPFSQRIFEGDLHPGAAIAFQALINSAVNLIDVVMLGKLGDADIAAAGCANQIFFLLTMVLFGTCTGASVFMAQFWGKRDVDGVHRTMGMMGLISLAASLLFTLGAMICPAR